MLLQIECVAMGDFNRGEVVDLVGFRMVEKTFEMSATNQGGF